MFENELPCLPVYKIKCNKIEDIDIDYELKSNNVFFDLEHGSNIICCSMRGEVEVKAFDVCEQGQSYEDSVERDFKFLQLNENIVNVEQSDIDLITGQKIELTEKQYCELNEYLKEKMEMM